MSVRSQTRHAPSEHTVPVLGSAEIIDLERFPLELVPPEFIRDTVEYILTW